MRDLLRHLLPCPEIPEQALVLARLSHTLSSSIFPVVENVEFVACSLLLQVHLKPGSCEYRAVFGVVDQSVDTDPEMVRLDGSVLLQVIGQRFVHDGVEYVYCTSLPL